MGKNKTGRCALCDRVANLTFHHLVPKKLHRRNHYRKQFDKEMLAQGVELCRPCHSALHRLYDEITLAKRLNSLALLREDPAVARHVGWVRKRRIRLDPG